MPAPSAIPLSSLSGDTPAGLELTRFASEAEVAGWEAARLAGGHGSTPAAIVRLAWHLRQRDSRRALDLANVARGQLPYETPALAAALTARLDLLQAEVHWLFAEIDLALPLAAAALQAFAQQGDRAGVADAHWLQAWLASDQGELERRDAELGRAIEVARESGDDLRAELAEAALARSLVFRDLHAAVARWGDRYLGAWREVEPSLATWIADFRTLVASKTQDIGASVANGMRMHDAALASGQRQRAITAATNIGFDLSRLNDHQAALEWLQRGLDLARGAGWPGSVGVCLVETAETLRQLERFDAAQDLLDEAMALPAPLARSRWRALALQYLGDLALDRGMPAEALDRFTGLQERADDLQQADLQAIARRGQAQALAELGRPKQALTAATAALALARGQGDGYNQIQALRVIASLHARRRADPDATPDGTPLRYLEQALAIADGIEGFITPPDLLEAIAREHAALGDHAAAYESSLRANVSRERIHSQLANQRAVAMQVRHETEAVRAESEHHRQLAAAEARRAETLLQTSATLERIGAVGREITATLELEAVLDTLLRHTRELLEVHSFGVYLLDADGRGMTSALLVESGQACAPDHIRLDSRVRHAARCARERIEIALARSGPDGDPSQVPGSLPTLSALFAPLLAGERLLGVLTVQSLQSGAYGERERLILRSLSAYGAIAIDNAAAYRQLERGQRELALLNELSARLQACPDYASAYAAIGASAPRLLPGSRGMLAVDEDDGSGEIERCRWDALDGSACTAPSLELPLGAQGQVLGRLRIDPGGAGGEAALARQRSLAVALGEQSALALANLRLRLALREQSIRDALTGAYNRRYLDETLPRELARCQRNGTPLALAMIDVDHFKRFNDRFGHAAGDAVLQEVASTLTSVFRRSDIVCRYGGEEFVALLPDAAPAYAEQRAQALLQAMRALVPMHAGRALDGVTLSVGLAAFPQHAETAEALVAAADAAMYRAKQGGRDRLVVADSLVDAAGRAEQGRRGSV